MMRAKTEQKVKRWKDQRWLIDTVIQAVGMEWDQPRLNYTMYPAGVDAIGDFRTVGMRVRKFADMHREFAAAGHRREIKAQAFENQGRTVSARESYFIAALLYSAARWPIFENNEKSIAYNDRMVACYAKFAAMMNRPVARVEVPFEGKALPAYLHLPREPKPGEKFPVAIAIDGMDASKEIMCSMYGDKFLERGMAHFVYDGPGQGECTYRDILVTPTNHMDAARAVYDWLSKHPNIDVNRSVIWSVSMGSFFGLQAAAALGDKVRGAAVTFVCHEPGLFSLMNRSAPSFFAEGKIELHAVGFRQPLSLGRERLHGGQVGVAGLEGFRVGEIEVDTCRARIEPQGFKVCFLRLPQMTKVLEHAARVDVSIDEFWLQRQRPAASLQRLAITPERPQRTAAIGVCLRTIRLQRDHAVAGRKRLIIAFQLVQRRPAIAQSIRVVGSQHQRAVASLHRLAVTP
jgi:Esterase FrsA-like